MPAITYDQFLTASTLALHGGEGAAASGVHRDWVKQLLPSALNKLAENVAEDPTKRPLLVTKVEVPISDQGNGVFQGTINTDTYRQILFSGLRYSSCFDKYAIEKGVQTLDFVGIQGAGVDMCLASG